MPQRGNFGGLGLDVRISYKYILKDCSIYVLTAFIWLSILVFSNGWMILTWKWTLQVPSNTAIFNHMSYYQHLKKDPFPYSQFLFLNYCMLMIAHTRLDNKVIFKNSLLLLLLMY